MCEYFSFTLPYALKKKLKPSTAGHTQLPPSTQKVPMEKPLPLSLVIVIALIRTTTTSYWMQVFSADSIKVHKTPDFC